MKAVRLEGVGRLAVREVEAPRPGPGEVLLRVAACGVCGTDRHLLRGEFPSRPPVTLGHEFAGWVEEVGDGVARVREGDLVTGDPNGSCGRCAPCRRGRVNLCEENRPLGLQRDGGFAERVVVPEAQAHVLPPGTDLLHGAFCEPLACGLHGVDLAAIRPGQGVVVLGGGVIGLLVVQLARLAGAGAVVLVTRSEARRALGLAVGATAAVDPGGDAVAAATGPEGALPGGGDVVFECAGVAATMAEAPRMARAGGTAVLLGVLAPGAQVPFEPYDLVLREVRVQGSFINPFTHARAAQLIGAGAVDVAPLVSRRVALDEVPDAIGNPPRPGEVRVLALPGG